MFASIDHLDPKEKILSFAQKMSKYLLDPFKLFTDISHFQYYEKNYAKIFSSLESLLLFSKTNVSNNLLSPKELILLLPQ